MTVLNISLAAYATCEKKFQIPAGPTTYSQEPSGDCHCTAFGTDNGINTFNNYDRAILQFNTAPLNGFTITKVELYRKFSSFVLAGAPDAPMRYYVGSHGTNPLTYNSTLFSGGTFCLLETLSANPAGSFIDLGAGAPAAINTSGYTTITVRNDRNDDYPNSAGDDQFLGYNVTSDPCVLRVTYSSGAIMGGHPQLMFGVP